ncbi:MAG: dephospho-CoA kinase [Alphaproteobacteria bacterium]
MIVVGLTGSIGMGKSTAATIFRRLGVPVQDADAVVHDLFQNNTAVIGQVEDAFPGAVTNGRVDRKKLGAMVFGKPDAIARLEAIVHPAVRAERDRFLARCRMRRLSACVLDIPLLFETGGDALCDEIVVVVAPPFVQAARVLKRPGMTPERLQSIRAKQMPDREKCRRATLVIQTGNGKRPVIRAIAALLRRVRASS